MEASALVRWQDLKNSWSFIKRDCCRHPSCPFGVCAGWLLGVDGVNRSTFVRFWPSNRVSAWVFQGSRHNCPATTHEGASTRERGMNSSERESPKRHRLKQNGNGTPIPPSPINPSSTPLPRSPAHALSYSPPPAGADVRAAGRGKPATTPPLGVSRRPSRGQQPARVRRRPQASRG